MRKKKLLAWSEARVDRILSRRLAGTPYRVFPNIRLSDAIGKEPGEFLPVEEFDFLTRAHLDFLVARGTRPAEPLFGVEFDGRHHDTPEQRARDVLKNHLCRKAGLPLIRVRAGEIEPYDRTTLLDYLLERIVGWEEEYDEIREEAAEHLRELSDETIAAALEVGDYPGTEPSMLFDERHPFPETEHVRGRLLERYRIAPDPLVGSRRRDVEYECRVWCKTSGPDDDEEFHRCVVEARVVDPSRGGGTIFHRHATASARAWLPTRTNLPRVDPFTLFNTATREEREAIVRALRTRVESMWFPHPAISAWDVAENFGEYLGYRAVEQWAARTLL